MAVVGSSPTDAPKYIKGKNMKEFIRIFTEPFECAGWKALLGVAYIVLSIVAYIVLLGA